MTERQRNVANKRMCWKRDFKSANYRIQWQKQDKVKSMLETLIKRWKHSSLRVFRLRRIIFVLCHTCVRSNMELSSLPFQLSDEKKKAKKLTNDQQITSIFVEDEFALETYRTIAQTRKQLW